ncbi:MAG: ABC transporter permease subunit [Rhizobiales bacterium]|nr:ABC transporter permease subunit [Hyphomicrobiales bacterium]
MPSRLLPRLNLPGLLTLVIVVLAWELAIRGGSVQYEYLPAPSAIAVGMAELIRSGQLAADTLHTLRSVLLGWTAAMVIGVTLGLWLGSSPLVRRYSLATIEMLRPMPGIAFVPVALLLFGFSLETELMVIILPALWPVLINTMGGVMGIHARLFEVGRTFRLPRGEIIRKLLLPAALPAILVGARISMTLALVLAVVAEMVGNPNGLGYAIVREQQALQPEKMFADVVAIGVLGIVLNSALVSAVAAFFPAASGRLREAG